MCFQYNKNNCKAMKGGKAPFWLRLQNVSFGVGEVISRSPHGQQQNTKTDCRFGNVADMEEEYAELYGSPEQAGRTSGP